MNFKNQLSENGGKLLETELPVKRKLLVLDAAWAFEAILERNLEDSVTCRDLDGFFEHVWSVHPFASLVTSEQWANKHGKPEHHQLNTSHTFIEGKVGRFSLLRRLPPLNFILSQIGIFVDLVHLIQKHNITMIRVGDPQYLGLFGWALSRVCKIPFVVRVAANYDKIFETTGLPAFKKLFFNRNIEKIIERFVLKRADLVVAGNQDNLNFARKNGARAEVSTLFRYGNLIDKRHFVHPKDRTDGTLILKELGVERGKFILCIGRLEEIKQPSHVLYVLADIRKRGNDIKALLVGDGSLRKQLQGLAQELGVESHVVFCGNREQGWLSQVIPLALSVVSPYTGRALVESALGAAPIVAYGVDWHSELIQNGETGELVSFQAWEEMAEGVNRFLADSSYARSMGEAVRKRALKMMDPSILNQHERNAYIKLYDGKLLETELPVKRRLLVLVTAYSLKMIRDRKLDQMITNRDLDGFFEHVWTVHPFSTIVSSNDSRGRYGFPATHAFAPGHTFIEGKVGRFSFLKWVEPLNFLISQVGIFFSLVRLIDKERISVVDAWTPLYPGLFAWALSRLCGIPFGIRVVANNDKIRETTGLPMEGKLWFSSKIEKRVERFVLKRADLVAAVNQDNLNFALASGARPEKSTLFRYGNMINRQHFSEPSERSDGSGLLRELGVEPHQFLLYTGRFESVKRPHDVVHAFAKVRAIGHDVKLIMAGDGSLREKLLEQVRELGVENQTIFCGNKDQEWLVSLIPLAAAVLSPHTGLALLEVALGECPIVAYDVDWQSELIESGVTGELVPFQAWEEMAEGVNRFLADSSYARSMGEAVRKRALKMMDPSILNQHERNTYMKLLSKS